jgi:hypothetical protein
MGAIENRLSKIEGKHTAGEEGPKIIFLVGIDPITKEETPDRAAMLLNVGKTIERQPGEPLEDFEARALAINNKI